MMGQLMKPKKTEITGKVLLTGENDIKRDDEDCHRKKISKLWISSVDASSKRLVKEGLLRETKGLSCSSNKVEADWFFCCFGGGGGNQSAMTRTHWSEKKTGSSFYSFIFEAKKFTAAIMVRPFFCETSVYKSIDTTQVVRTAATIFYECGS